MAKTNWVLNEIVMPADMNQIGTEINAKAEINNTILTGTETLGDRWCRRTLGTALSLPNSPNQKIRISLPSLNFGGNIKLTVLGSYNALNLNGIMEKSFTGNLVGNNQNFEGNSNYEKVYSAIQTSNGFLNSCQISDLKSDSNGFFFEFCVSVSTITHVFSFFLEAKNSSGVNLSDIIKGASLGTFYADTVVLPKAIVQERQLQLTAPQGTSPLLVASNTKVDNLNVDYVNGWKIFNNVASISSSLSNSSSMNDILTAMRDFSILNLGVSNANLSALSLTEQGILTIIKINSTRASAEFTNYNGMIKKGIINGSIVFSGWIDITAQGSSITGTQITSTAPQGTAPLVVTSNTKVNNLNSDLLDDMHADVNKTASTIVARKSDGGVNAGGFSSFEQIGVKLTGRNREVRITQDANNISYIQLVNDSGGFISNPIQINADGTAGLNVSTNVIAYTNPATPQVRNTHVGNTAPSNSLGINGDIYIEL